MKTLLDGPGLCVVNAAKAWHRADDTNRERREKRLHKMVENYLDAEATRKAKLKDRDLHAEAAAKDVWVDGDGKETAYTKLDGNHLFHIRKKLHVDAESYDGICSEIQRRAPGPEILWATGIPFSYEKTTQNGDQAKVSFRNVLTRKLEHIEIDRENFVVAWSGYMHHGLSGDQARTLYEAWQAAGVKTDGPHVG